MSKCYRIFNSQLFVALQEMAVKRLQSGNYRHHTPLLQAAQCGTKTTRFSHQDKFERQRKLLMEKRKKIVEAKKKIPVLSIPYSITVGDLAKLANRTPEQIYHMKAVAENAEFVEMRRYPLKAQFSGALLSQIVKLLGYKPLTLPKEVLTVKDDNDIYAQPITTDPSKLHPRPPIVAVMGHVDHGKTTLLDTLRRASVAANEAGGITQSIGAFSVPLTTNQTVTFIDTPGHSVFTSMRARGAKVTDIVVLVVAADDGVMEQTIESINMAKMAEATIVVALNKCDKKDADPDLVIEDLDSHGIKCEQLGGSIPAVKISALKNLGMDKLVETIVAQAEFLELQHDPNMQVQGYILESKTEKGRGNTASIIMKQGTLEKGMVIIAGNSMAKVRQIFDANAKVLKKLHAGEAGSIMGWKSLPKPGQIVLQAESELQARNAIKHREKEMEILKTDDIRKEVEKQRGLDREEYERISNLYRTTKDRYAAFFELNLERNKVDDTTPRLSILVKADVDGSMEAIMKILDSYDCHDVCNLDVVSVSVGRLIASEYELAERLNATILLFNTDVDGEVKKMLTESVEIMQHKVIYHLVNALKEKINSILPPLDKKELKGEASVLQIFKSKKRLIAGCKVNSGILEMNDEFLLVRNDEVIHEGPLESMRQGTTVISKMTAGNECGLLFSENPEDGIEEGDIIQCCTIVKEDQKIPWHIPGF